MTRGTGRSWWLLMLCLLLASLASGVLTAAGPPVWPSADPGVRDQGSFDPRRPLAAEAQLSIPDHFTVALAGDMIVARPLSVGGRVPDLEPLLQVIRASDAAFGNLETTLIDIRHFRGAPYPFEGDWANIGAPAVAADLRHMGFALVGRANNHALDWGIEGMRETAGHLDTAGLVHAGSGSR